MKLLRVPYTDHLEANVEVGFYLSTFFYTHFFIYYCNICVCVCVVYSLSQQTPLMSPPPHLVSNAVSPGQAPGETAILLETDWKQLFCSYVEETIIYMCSVKTVIQH